MLGFTLLTIAFNMYFVLSNMCKFMYLVCLRGYNRCACCESKKAPEVEPAMTELIKIDEVKKDVKLEEFKEDKSSKVAVKEQVGVSKL